MLTPEELRRVVAGVASGDPGAADAVERLGRDLLALAGRLRAGGGGISSAGSIGDRVRVQVVGPDGAIKQTADTGDRQ